jgi:hypothetical protein
VQCLDARPCRPEAAVMLGLFEGILERREHHVENVCRFVDWRLQIDALVDKQLCASEVVLSVVGIKVVAASEGRLRVSNTDSKFCLRDGAYYGGIIKFMEIGNYVYIYMSLMLQ